MTILPTNYIEMIRQANPGNEIMGFIVFALQFQIFMVIYIIINILLTISMCWGMLVVFRILGIPWLDGTTKGFIKRS